jgi:SHS family lactate transporter-like MFS transporter
MSLMTPAADDTPAADAGAAAVARPSLRSLTPAQRSAFVAAFLGWTLDAFDYFILVFVLKDVAHDFHVTVKVVSFALMITLACRPIGAFLFGLAADRFGRRVPLMVDVILFSAIELASGFAPNLATFLVLRGLFGVAMGGEWGLGASLALETCPAGLRGLLSGILQEGYAVGYLLAALIFPWVVPQHGWRWMFFIGALPALLSLFIRMQVKESPVWMETQRRQRAAAGEPRGSIAPLLKKNAGLFVYLVILMACFNFMSHGTQDLYPTFLQVQRRLSPGTVSAILIVANIGALIGGIFFGWLSQRVGRRRAIVLAALLALPVAPLWAFSRTPFLLAGGAFLMQFFVQGAWGVIPAHLTELSPNALRGTFTGFAYQVGNLIASVNSPIQTGIAERRRGDYAGALAATIGIVLVAVAVVTAYGSEASGAEFAAPQEDEA